MKTTQNAEFQFWQVLDQWKLTFASATALQNFSGNQIQQVPVLAISEFMRLYGFESLYEFLQTQPHPLSPVASFIPKDPQFFCVCYDDSKYKTYSV